MSEKKTEKIKIDEIILDRKILRTIRLFAIKKNKKTISSNEFIMSFKSDRQQEQLAYLMSEYIRVRLRDIDAAFMLPEGEVGMMFKRHLDILIANELPNRRMSWRPRKSAIRMKDIMGRFCK